jgi:hypothetical protein
MAARVFIASNLSPTICGPLSTAHRIAAVPTRVAVLWIALLALCPALAGCGGGDDDRLTAGAYRARLTQLSQQQTKTYGNVEKAFGSNSVSEIKAGLTTFADDEQRLGDDVAELKPPKDAEAANDQLASGARALADDVRAAVAELEGITRAKTARDLVDRRLANSEKELGDALTKLNKLGYASTI